jgi:hypothetical protein
MRGCAAARLRGRSASSKQIVPNWLKISAVRSITADQSHHDAMTASPLVLHRTILGDGQ